MSCHRSNQQGIRVLDHMASGIWDWMATAEHVVLQVHKRALDKIDIRAQGYPEGENVHFKLQSTEMKIEWRLVDSLCGSTDSYGRHLVNPRAAAAGTFFEAAQQAMENATLSEYIGSDIAKHYNSLSLNRALQNLPVTGCSVDALLECDVPCHCGCYAAKNPYKSFSLDELSDIQKFTFRTSIETCLAFTHPLPREVRMQIFAALLKFWLKDGSLGFHCQRLYVRVHCLQSCINKTPGPNGDMSEVLELLNQGGPEEMVRAIFREDEFGKMFSI